MQSNVRLIIAEQGDWRLHKLHPAAAQTQSRHILDQVKQLFESGVALWKHRLEVRQILLPQSKQYRLTFVFC